MAIPTITNLALAIAQGARPNQFMVSMTPPTALKANFDAFDFVLCKAAALPEYTIGTINVPFRGRTIKLPGDRTFAEWTATFFVDSAMKVRPAFEAWMRSIRTNNFDTDASTFAAYFGSVTVTQLDSSGTAVAGGTVKLNNAFPTDISAIDLSFDSTDAIEEFSVTFQYTWHE